MSGTRGIAIIGVACRFPGVANPREFWRNLCDGVESIRFFSDAELAEAGVPAATLQDPAYVKASPTIADIEQFDAAFFEYSPREATLMDPQHRLLLEVAWEAFEDAGQVPGAAKDPVAVFAGTGGIVSTYLIGRMPFTSELPDYTGTLAHIGNDKDFPSTRISYKLNLTGPSINVQTACSTSLVAMHLACQSILSGESGMALVGAASVRVPHVAGHMGVKGGIWSLDGHCRAFDAEATGTVFGSGVGAVLLKDVSQAIADGDNIYAVIRGSAVNNDGAEKVSYTAPSAAAQARAMVEALTIADVSPEQIGYVECHGTGTIVGDPLEIDALTRAFRTRTDRRGFCTVGSVKANIGHLEQTAGLAAIIKTALALKFRQIPPQINFSAANPKIDFAASPFVVSTELREWPSSGAPRFAAVNSLGVGGTNAFLVLEEAPALPPIGADDGRQHLFTLSARSDAALAVAIARQRDWLAENPLADIADICATLSAGRTHFPRRFSAVVASVPELRAALAEDAAPLAFAAARPGKQRVAFLYSGQGSQYPGMAAELYRHEPVFRAVIDQCATELQGRIDPPLLDVVFDRNGQGSLIHETAYTQPALFAVQVALTSLWRSWGVVPEFVLGHSVGEFAAAVCAGVYTLEQALGLITERARLMQALPPTGSMAAIFDDADAVAEAIAAHGPGRLAIAARNGPHSTVISGERDAVAAVAAEFERRGIRSQVLTVSHAFHSPLMRPAMAGLSEYAAGTDAQAPRMNWVSTLTAEAVSGAPDAGYWCDHALRPVDFLGAMRALGAAGATDFIEIGPGGTLLALGRQCIEGDGLGWHASLGRRGEQREILASLGGLYAGGLAVDWEGFHRPHAFHRIALPTYPFEHRRFWLEDNRRPYEAQDTTVGLAGIRLRSALPEVQFEARYSLDRLPWLGDHRIYAMPVLPTTVGLAALTDAARQHFGTDRVAVENLQYREALVLPESGEGDADRVVQILLSPVQAGRAEFRLASLHPDGTWHTHMLGVVSSDGGATPEHVQLDTIRSRCTMTIPVERYYPAIHGLGLEYGPSFQGIQSLQRGDGETLSHVVLPASVRADAALHPALLDACLHVYPALVPGYGDFGPDAALSRPVFLPISVERFAAIAEGRRAVWVHAVRRQAPVAPDGILVVDIAIYAEDGAWVAGIEGLSLKPLAAEKLNPELAAGKLDCLYQVQWQAQPAPPTLAGDAADGAWLLLADRGGVAAEIAAELRRSGAACDLLYIDDRVMADDARVWGSSETLADDFRRVLAAHDAAGAPVRRILHLWALDPVDDADPQGGQRRIAGSALALFQALDAARAEGSADARIWLITANAVAVSGDAAVQPEGGTLWGLGRSAALEHPQIWGGLIDFDRLSGTAGMANEILHGDGEDQIALRAGNRFAARFVRLARPEPALEPMDPEGTYLVTGGLGALGVEVAKFLVTRRGAKHLALVSRRGEADPAAAAIREMLEGLGATIRIQAADITCAEDIARLIGDIGAGPFALKGVFHAAGLLDDGIVAQMDWAKFWRVMAPKVAGGWLLHEYTKDLALDHFVLFSSVLSLIGSAGQTNYTAANGYLDALAAHRRALGLPALALNWGPWAESGLATASGERGEAIWRSRGTHYIPVETGWQAMEALIGSAAGHAAITLTDWAVFLRQFSSVPPFFSALVRAVPGRATGNGHAGAIRRELETADPEGRLALLVGFIRQQARTTLALTEEIDPSRSLREYGLDSLMAVTLVNRLEGALGVKIATTKLIAGPSVQTLAADILPDLAFGEARAEARAESRPEPAAAGRWIVTVGPRAAPRMRLFCFPFAGGGSGVFQAWAQGIDPGIEVVAIEPPGRLSRILEPPVTEMDEFVGQLLPEMAPLLDLPFAFFGHCLGGLTMYETARRLIGSSNHLPMHLFASGARPPDALADTGPFEERLANDLMALAEFRVNLPAHLQPDDVFADIVRHFDMQATDRFLDDPELRRLMLPVVRAEFQMVANYTHVSESPWEIPITCFANRGDTYVSRQHALGWGRFTNTRLQIHIRKGDHYSIVDDVKFIQTEINRELRA